MSMLDMNVEDVADLVLLPPEQYELKIANAEIKTFKGKEGKPDGSFLNIMFVAENEENSAPIFHRIFMLNGTEDAAQKASTQRRFKAFFQAFDMPLSGNLDTADMKGMTGWAKVKIKPAQGDYDESNEVAKFIVPN